MSQAIPATITHALTASDLNHTINGEPRILDMRLAQALGFQAPHRIRSLIRRHRPALERLGKVLTTVVQTSRRGGRPGNAVWLTKRQALFLCTKSETERATEITIQVVEVYDEVTSRATAPPPDPNAAIPRRRGLPASITREMLETYLAWLNGECSLLLEELYPGKSSWERGIVLTNPGGAYHDGVPGTVVPSPSTRAEAVLRLVRCSLPRPDRRPRSLPRS